MNNKPKVKKNKVDQVTPETCREAEEGHARIERPFLFEQDRKILEELSRQSKYMHGISRI